MRKYSLTAIRRGTCPCSSWPTSLPISRSARRPEPENTRETDKSFGAVTKAGTRLTDKRTPNVSPIASLPQARRRGGTTEEGGHPHIPERLKSVVFFIHNPAIR